jgi:predicted metalloendopeptidase
LANGRSFQLPRDRAKDMWFTAARDATERRLRGIVDGLAQRAPGDTDAVKLIDLYASFMG